MRSINKDQALNGSVKAARIITPATTAMLAYLMWRMLDKIDALILKVQEILIYVKLQHGG